MDQCLPVTGGNVSVSLVVAVALMAVGVVAVCVGRSRTAPLLAVAIISAGVVLAAGVTASASASADCPPDDVSATTAPPLTTVAQTPTAPTTVPVEPTTTAMIAPPTSGTPTTSASSSTTSTTATTTTTTTTTTTDDDHDDGARGGARRRCRNCRRHWAYVGSLLEEGDDLGVPEASIVDLIAIQGPGAIPFGSETEIFDVNGRSCGVINVGVDGAYSFVPTLPAPRECTIEYTLSNTAGTSTATETIQVVAGEV